MGTTVLTYVRPTQATKLPSYFFDTFGPYAIAGAALAAGIFQDRQWMLWGEVASLSCGSRSTHEHIGSVLAAEFSGCPIENGSEPFGL